MFSPQQEIPPFQALQAVGHTVHAVCPHTKAGDHIKTAIHDFEGAQTYRDKPDHHFTLNASFADVKPEQYDALVIAGGRGPEYLRNEPAVIAAVRHFFDANQPVAAACHGAQWLAGAGVLKDRTCSAYSSCKVEVALVGGVYADIAVDQAHTDGNLVSARLGPPTLHGRRSFWSCSAPASRYKTPNCYLWRCWPKTSWQHRPNAIQ